MMKYPKLSELLAQSKQKSDKISADEIVQLQLKMLRIQQGVWHSGRRAIIVFEGFDASGKGSSIRSMLEKLDPRGIRVEAIGPPEDRDQNRHYLYRFWRALPAPGTITVFDRSWYGRVLVERVEELTPKHRWTQAYEEIRSFETTLTNDGIDLIKIFLAISPLEQLRRFEARIKDPYKQWKLTESDLRAHKKWDSYVKAANDLLKETHTKVHPWYLIPSDSKTLTQRKVLKVVTAELSKHGAWIEEKAEEIKTNQLHQMMLTDIEKARKKLKRFR